MKFTNSWTSVNKQKDKINFELRVSVVTIFKLYLDISDKKFKMVFFNFGLSN